MLGLAQHAGGDFAASESTLRECVGRLKDESGDHGSALAVGRIDLAAVLIDAGKRAEADELLALADTCPRLIGRERNRIAKLRSK